MQCFKVFLKDCNAVFVCFFPEIRTVHGWGQSHLKTYIQRIVLSTEPFLRDILGPRYLKNNSGLSVNQYFSMYFHIFSKSRTKNELLIDLILYNEQVS